MRLVSLVLLCLLSQSVTAQQVSPFAKFGKVTVAHLQKRKYAIDSNASAVVLSDIGYAAIEGNSKGWFSISFIRHKLVHILNKRAYEEADVEIPLYASNGDEEKLEWVKAVTYNLKEGKLVETKLDRSAVYKEKKDAHHVVRKFTFPNVREGSIIEYEYKLTSDFISNLDPWFFQGDLPELWSEFNLRVPQFFTYTFLQHGYLSMYLKDKKDSRNNFIVTDTRTTGSSQSMNFTASVTDYRWAMKDVPVIKEEIYSSALKNHIASIEFQLASRNYPLEYKDYKSSWSMLTTELLQSESFGAVLQKENNWVGDELKPVLKGTVTELEKAIKIFNYVRDHFTCTVYDGLYLEQPLKNLVKTRKGNVAEINVLLTVMLRYAGLDASPVILSTSDHGYVIETYPLVTSFNYVISRLVIDTNKFYLDASRQRLGFDRLMPECYNGHARIVNEEATAINLSADSIKEKKTTIVFIGNNKDGKWKGSVKQTPGYYESFDIRERIKTEGRDLFFKTIEKGFDIKAKISEAVVDSLDKYEAPVTLHYIVELETRKDEMMYINPVFDEAYKNNPFSATERHYPVEMPFTIDETYLATIEVPTGYTMESMPEQVIAKMDEQGSGYFEYRISYSGNIISLKMVLQLTRSFFSAGRI